MGRFSRLHHEFHPFPSVGLGVNIFSASGHAFENELGFVVYIVIVVHRTIMERPGMTAARKTPSCNMCMRGRLMKIPLSGDLHTEHSPGPIQRCSDRDPIFVFPSTNSPSPGN